MKPPIRPAADRDADAVIDLWTEAYVTLGVGGRTTPYADTDFAHSMRHGEVSVVDEPDGIVGVVVLLPPGAPEQAVGRPGEAELARLAVAAKARRMGIGRALACFCEQRARAGGWEAIVLWSRPAQVEAHRLYESLGYLRAPERDSVDETGHGRVVFRLGL
ncbi:MAG TPA: GNAT family N-acetyltransferase [Solirubrobacterales bacterium]|jgi:ribosomal protein S18 acetylase RimI-like enzyme